MRGKPVTGRLRHHFRKRENAYAGVDLPSAIRLGGALWVLGFMVVAGLLPVAPPTQSLPGAQGWIVASAALLFALAAAARAFVAPGRITIPQLLLTGYAALAGIALMEWLAGGRSSPYHQLFVLCVVFTAMAHPPRKLPPYVLAYFVAVGAPFVYGDWTSTQLGDLGLEVLLTLGFAAISSVLMEGVRAQRVALREQGEADRRDAETDALTGLGNRRALTSDLETQAGGADPDRPLLLALFDLDGFKAYNDAFGHPAGDALLVRLAARLDASVVAGGRAYRMGGDEFCVLARTTHAEVLDVVDAAGSALCEDGDGFTIGASHGSVLLPVDTADPHEALRIADARMYARKSLGRTSAGRQSTDVLLSVLAERDPAQGGAVTAAAETCVTIGRELGLDESQLVALRAAGALHDIGKLAVPDAILSKPGPLTEAEWEFVRRHPLIGERILRAAPALAPVGPLVRASHERFDGGGYPDGIAGDEIPLASRIVAVCDAYDAMTSGRPYRAAMSDEGAVDELRRCSGSQFDPQVVAAFERVRAAEGAAVQR